MPSGAASSGHPGEFPLPFLQGEAVGYLASRGTLLPCTISQCFTERFSQRDRSREARRFLGSQLGQ